MNLDDQLDKIKEGEYLIYVVDSLDGLSSEAELKKIQEEIAAKKAGKKVKGDYGAQKAKKMSQIFRTVKRKIRKRNCLLIIISQVRENLNATMFQPKHYRTGGKAMDFYALQVFWLAQRSEILRKKTSIGVLTKIINTKNKVGKPCRSGYAALYFDYGIDHVISNIRYLYGLYTEKGEIRNSKVKWEDVEYTPKALVSYIEDNDLEEELEKRVIKKWNDFEDSIAVKDRKKKY
jgi:RecA/RadA recombinase